MHCEALNYPFFYLGSTGAFSDPTVRLKFYDSIVSTPGKARDEGFTLHVLARLSPTWREGMLLFIQNVLASRCPPSSIKEMSRLPIPKGPEKPGQTRPIALVNDIYAFISSMIASRMAEGIEKSGRLGPEVRAYRKNMSTTDITMNERCLMEDAMEFEKPTCRKLEDEEKFFDRVLLIVQLLLMKLFGFPDQGYSEMKAEDMTNRVVKLITRYGKEEATFLAGLPQGSPISVLLANLATWLKHKVKQGTVARIQQTRGD